MNDKNTSYHIKLTSHPDHQSKLSLPIHWGAKTLLERGPIIATTSQNDHRNVIGTHSGSYSIYRALAVASGTLDPDHRPDFRNTAPSTKIPFSSSWTNKDKIVSLDPFGHLVISEFENLLKKGYDIRPTIAVTQAHIDILEIHKALLEKRLHPDEKVLLKNGQAKVTKAAIEPVWFLPGLAKRFNCKESDLRRILFQNTGGMYPELITRQDLKIFLPPIGNITIYIFGDITSISNTRRPLTVRVHDECNGSDVFGSDICTCRPYLTHGIEECIKSAQKGGAGVIIYNRKEGRALGEVTKFLVYNARKRQKGGDRADKYFERTECVAGTQDVRFQELMPDALHWLGIKSIDKFISMSNMKYDALINSGIKIKERVSLPESYITKEAQVEIAAKKAAGYFSSTQSKESKDLKYIKGRSIK